MQGRKGLDKLLKCVKKDDLIVFDSASRMSRNAEEAMAKLFSEKKPFSEHFYKWEDSVLPDEYDHNCFEYIS